MQQFHVLDIKRLTNTYNGGPRFQFTCTDWDGNKIKMQTRGDTMWSYAVSSSWIGRNIYAETKTTKKITFIEHAKVRCFAEEAA
jgi:hypothetical protein